MQNNMKLIFPAISQNESLARMVISAFVSQLNPDLEQLSDIKTAVSEAVTNSIIHGYAKYPGSITMQANVDEERLEIKIIDEGLGIENIEQAREPFYTSKPHLERSGMGFTVMEAFMDEVDVLSGQGMGTTVIMRKTIHPRYETEERAVL